jgi:5S rRNA maturation endonuclease (ribonuclease M5)
MDYEKSLEEIEKTLFYLRDENKEFPIIVEGEKDIIALRKMNIKGVILPVNTGLSIVDFCDKLAEKYKQIIILTDWDRKGGYICHTIIKNLRGRVTCNTFYREIFAKNTMIKTIEGLPSWINTLRNKL